MLFRINKTGSSMVLCRTGALIQQYGLLRQSVLGLSPSTFKDLYIFNPHFFAMHHKASDDGARIIKQPGMSLNPEFSGIVPADSPQSSS
jgi:hypothetical protein